MVAIHGCKVRHLCATPSTKMPHSLPVWTYFLTVWICCKISNYTNLFDLPHLLISAWIVQIWTVTNTITKGDKMRIIETKVYKFDELNDKAKKRARDWYRDGDMLNQDFDYLLEDEQVDESIRVNGYTFTANGKRMG